MSFLADGNAGEGVRNADPRSDEGQTHHRVRDTQGESCGIGSSDFDIFLEIQYASANGYE
jgi:hypothetical protein